MTQHSIETKTLPELKQLALEELGLTREAVKQHGDLRSRSTWLKAIMIAYKDGLTTKSYQELPITQATALQHNATDSEALQHNAVDDGLIELSVIPWLHDPAARENIEQVFSKKDSHNLIINSSDLEQCKGTFGRFCYYKDWMHPGKFVEVYPLGLAQVLFFDTYAHIYYIPFKDNRVHRQRLYSFVEYATPTRLTHQEAVEYVNKLYEVATVGGTAAIVV
jgi:hypothetical protein